MDINELNDQLEMQMWSSVTIQKELRIIRNILCLVFRNAQPIVKSEAGPINVNALISVVNETSSGPIGSQSSIFSVLLIKTSALQLHCHEDHS